MRRSSIPLEVAAVAAALGANVERPVALEQRRRIAAYALALADTDVDLAGRLARTLPASRGRHPLELLPHDGLVLYDDERELLAWVREGKAPELARIVESSPESGDVTRGDVLEGALVSLSRMRVRRLEELAGRERPPAADPDRRRPIAPRR